MTFEKLAAEAAETASARLEAGASPEDLADALLTTAMAIAIAAIGGDIALRWLRRFTDDLERHHAGR